MDIFSKQLRSRLPWNEQLALIGDLSEGSLTLRESFANAELEARVALLDSIEKEKGFVFYAEKCWLSQSSGMTYPEWVSREMMLLNDQENLEGSPRIAADPDGEWQWTGRINVGAIPQCEDDGYGQHIDGLFNDPGYTIVSKGPELKNREFAITQAFHIFFNLDHYTRSAFDACYLESPKTGEETGPKFDSSKVWKRGISATEADEVSCHAEGVVFLEGAPFSQIWVLLFGSASGHSTPEYFLGHKMDLGYRRSHKEHHDISFSTLDPYVAENGHLFDPSRLFWV